MQEVTQTPKKSSKKTLIIVLSVIGGVILISVIVGAILLNGLFKSAKNAVDEYVDTDQQTTTETDQESEVDATAPLLTEDLEERSLLASDFPSDVPLSGGKVVSSSSDEWDIVAQISTGSTLDDTFDWYVSELEEAEWEISSKSKDSGYAEIKFEKGDRRGDVKLTHYEWNDTTTIEVRELVF